MSSTFTPVCAIALVALIVYYLSRGESGKAIRTGETWLIMFGAFFLAELILYLVIRTGEDRPAGYLSRGLWSLPRSLMLAAALWAVVCVLAGILSVCLGKREGPGALPTVLSGFLFITAAVFMILLRAHLSIWIFHRLRRAVPRIPEAAPRSAEERRRMNSNRSRQKRTSLSC